jgi:hypothetical protein
MQGSMELLAKHHVRVSVTRLIIYLQMRKGTSMNGS